MPITAKENSKPRVLIPEGTHEAICYLVVDIGTQVTNYGDKRKIVIAWEFPELRMEMEDGSDKPRVKSKILTLSLHEKSILRPLLEGWRAKTFTPQELKDGFDISKLLGCNCSMQILHRTGDNGIVYDEIRNVTPPNTGKVAVVPTENPHLYFSLQDGNDIPEGVYDWLKTKIKDSVEWNDKSQQEPEHYDDGPPETDEDDIPF
jgi:hypothetical protein